MQCLQEPSTNLKTCRASSEMLCKDSLTAVGKLPSNILTLSCRHGGFN